VGVFDIIPVALLILGMGASSPHHPNQVFHSLRDRSKKGPSAFVGSWVLAILQKARPQSDVKGILFYLSFEFSSYKAPTPGLLKRSKSQ
jgi:hypothetical protein